MRRSITLLSILLLLIVTVATGAPAPVAAQDCTNDAEILEQTRDPASGPIAPGAAFTASWKLRNSGDCAWSRTYRLIFVAGERMDSPRTLRLSEAVQPGNATTLTLDLTAPSEEGTYTSTWQLRSDGGDNFGPALVLTVAVSATTSAGSGPDLPQVLVFGGFGEMASFDLLG